MTIAITDAITTLAEAERRFSLTRTEGETFFQAWQVDVVLPRTVNQWSYLLLTTKITPQMMNPKPIKCLTEMDSLKIK